MPDARLIMTDYRPRPGGDIEAEPVTVEQRDPGYVVLHLDDGQEMGLYLDDLLGEVA